MKTEFSIADGIHQEEMGFSSRFQMPVLKQNLQ
jgi:hypothetical protein